MIISKKYGTYSRLFVLFVTTLLLTACTPAGFRKTRIEAAKTPVTAALHETPAIEAFIAPYREHLNKDLDSILAYAPETFDKSQGKGSTTIGNLLAEATLERASKLFYTQNNLPVDGCLLNHGGIRSIIAKGPVTTRTAFEVMPFENRLVIVALKGTQLQEMADYIIREKKPHPMANITVKYVTNQLHSEIYIRNDKVLPEKTYYIATMDYLLNGGDSMTFFATNEGVYDLNYKMRDLYIDYFREVDTLPVITTQHIITHQP